MPPVARRARWHQWSGLSRGIFYGATPFPRWLLAQYVGNRCRSLGESGAEVLAEYCSDGGGDLRLRDRGAVFSLAERERVGTENGGPPLAAVRDFVVVARPILGRHAAA